jgi:hypothetical protein
LSFTFAAGGAFTLEFWSDSALAIGLNWVAIFVVYHFAGPKTTAPPSTIIHTPPEESA